MDSENTADSLRVDDVSRKFADAADTLARVTQQLEALGLAEERERISSDSLVKTAAAVDGFASSAQMAATALEAATEVARRALEGATALLGGSDIERIHVSIGQASEQVEAGFQSLGSRVDEIVRLQESQLRRELESTKQELENTKQELRTTNQELERVKTVLSGRQRRKLGL